ncbi:MFS transporter [Actinomadura rubteroloni]|uniref:MFS transporter n=1 Tax=Actinomadura rubteroloni TaxID=1926885 RepID=UPI00196A5A22|nr:MFS transporter [Actinomadura rubteroloni]
MAEAVADRRAPERADARRVLLWSCLVVFMAQMATTIYLPALPAVMRELDVSRGFAGASISVFVIGAAAPVVPWGRAADRYGRRGPLLASLGLFVACCVALAVTTSPALLLVLRALQGIGAGGSAIIARIAVRDLGSGDQLARRLSVLSIAFITALGGGQFTGGLLTRYADWRLGFVVLAVVGAAAIATSFALPFGPARPAGEAGNVFRVGLRLLRTPGFALPTYAGGLGFATVVVLQEVAPFVFQQHFGLAADAYGGVGLLLAPAYFAGAMTVNRTVARFGAGRLMRTGALIMTGSGLAMVVLWSLDAGRVPALTAFIALYCVTTFGQAVLFPNSMAAAASADPAHGAYAIALCGFVQQSTAGLAALAATPLRAELAWSATAAALSALAWFLVRGTTLSKGASR